MQQTSAVRSSIASANCSAEIAPVRRPDARGRPRAPRSSCAWAIWPIVGNSYSLITIRFRSPSSGSAETSALTPCETDVVTATSSASAWSSPAIALRNASFRSTQKPHSAPFASQPASHSSTAVRTRCESAPCEHELRYVAVSKIGNSPRIAAPTPTRLNGQGMPFAGPRRRAARPRCPRGRRGPSRGRSRGRRSRARRSRSARRRASRRLRRSPAR